jgi:hypothetical protein
MPNMSYCAAENTLRAIRQLSDIIESGDKDEDVESKNGYEYLAIKQLAEEASYLGELCDELIEKYA